MRIRFVRRARPNSLRRVPLARRIAAPLLKRCVPARLLDTSAAGAPALKGLTSAAGAPNCRMRASDRGRPPDVFWFGKPEPTEFFAASALEEEGLSERDVSS